MFLPTLTCEVFVFSPVSAFRRLPPPSAASRRLPPRPAASRPLPHTHSPTHSLTHSLTHTLTHSRRGRRRTMCIAKGSDIRPGVPWGSASFVWQAWVNVHCQGVGYMPWRPLGLRLFCVAGVAYFPSSATWLFRSKAWRFISLAHSD